MRPSQALSYIIFFLLATSSCSASILDDACKTFSAARPDIGYNCCIEFFQANKDIVTADKRGLATIATNITRATAMNTRKLTAALRTMVKDQKTRECLGDCAVLYYGVVGRLDEATKGIMSGRSHGLQDIVWSLSAALNVPETYEEGFRKLGGKPMLAAADSEFSKEVSVRINHVIN
ncbi:hypothetical protein ACQ4PT_023129 [Festuca glaucescens]